MRTITFFLLFTLTLLSIALANETSKIGKAYVCYLILDIEIYPNETSYAKGQTAQLRAFVTQLCGKEYSNATSDTNVTANITTPKGTTDAIVFSNVGNGTWEYNYTFLYIGDYNITGGASNTATDEEPQKGRTVLLISVPKLSLTVQFAGGTEYESGEEIKINTYTKDDDGLPVANANVSIVYIKYPNETNYISNVNMTSRGDGSYYYNFTAPDIEGIYSILVNATFGSDWDWSMKDFHIAPWAGRIKNIETNITQFFSSWNSSFYGDFELIGAVPSDMYTGTNLIVRALTFTREGYTTPDWVNLTVYDSTNTTVVNNQPMSAVSTGQYYYNYTLPSSDTGSYFAKIEAKKSSYYDMDIHGFRVASAEADLIVDAEDYVHERDDAWAYITVKNMGDVGTDFYLTYWVQDVDGRTISSKSKTVFIAPRGTWLTHEYLPIYDMTDGEIGYYHANVSFAGQVRSAHDIFIVTKKSGPTYWQKAKLQYYKALDTCGFYSYGFLILVLIILALYLFWYRRKYEEFKKKYKWTIIIIIIILVIFGLFSITTCWL